MRKFLILCFSLLLLTTGFALKFKEPKNSVELLNLFPKEFVSSATGLKIDNVTFSPLKSLISCNYNLAGKKNIAVIIVFEKHGYQEYLAGLKSLGYSLKTSPKIKINHSVVYTSKGKFFDICLEPKRDQLLRVTTGHPKIVTADKLIMLASKIAEKIK